MGTLLFTGFCPTDSNHPKVDARHTIGLHIPSVILRCGYITLIFNQNAPIDNVLQFLIAKQQVFEQYYTIFFVCLVQLIDSDWKCIWYWYVDLSIAPFDLGAFFVKYLSAPNHAMFSAGSTQTFAAGKKLFTSVSFDKSTNFDLCLVVDGKGFSG